jgi:tRNA threonylcarbamoyl adenosine modification protein (Sua5/YciO/YrdC/YwlC family)
VSDTVAAAVAALRAGGVVVLPTDTVYGLAVLPESEQAVRELYALKGRGEAQPTALVASSVVGLLELVPELRRSEQILSAMFPGAYTLVLSNPARRYPWLCGPGASTIGVRVPAVAGPWADVLAAVGSVAATSANLPGGPDPRRLADIPDGLVARAAAAVDGGELLGAPSTVLDLSGPEPRVLREGAVPAAEALSRVRHAIP